MWSIPRSISIRRRSFQCAGIVAENFFIFPNGRVYQCPLCEDHPIHSYAIENNRLVHREGLNEDRFFPLDHPGGLRDEQAAPARQYQLPPRRRPGSPYFLLPPQAGGSSALLRTRLQPRPDLVENKGGRVIKRSPLLLFLVGNDQVLNLAIISFSLSAMPDNSSALSLTWRLAWFISLALLLTVAISEAISAETVEL